MEVLNPALIHFVPVAASALVTAIWEGTLLALCVAGCLRLLPALSAAARSLIWTGVFLIAALLPLATVLRADATAQSWHTTGFRVGLQWAYAVMGVWALLSLVRGAQLLRSAYHLYGVAKRATPIVAEQELSEVLAREQKATFRRAVQLCSSAEVDVPSVIGFFSPRILVPPALLTKISPDDFHQIMLHELEHLRRNDDWTNLMQKLGLVLLPVNPVLLWIERRLCVERELACDDGVLRSTGASKAYATCLVNLAEESLMRRGVSLALGAWQRRSELALRVQRILRRPERQMGRQWTKAVVGCALASVLTGATVLTQMPQFVTFAGDNAGQVAATPTFDEVLTPSMNTGTTAHPTLVNVVMPQRSVRAITSGETHSRHRSVRRRKPYMEEISQRREDRTSAPVVFIGWHSSSDTGRMTLVSAENSQKDSQFIYAAVPVQNGWLIVQL
jgi:beta-lactamase regulating signal transducer with metallopeptidase domain